MYFHRVKNGAFCALRDIRFNARLLLLFLLLENNPNSADKKFPNPCIESVCFVTTNLYISRCWEFRFYCDCIARIVEYAEKHKVEPRFIVCLLINKTTI